MGYRVHPEIFRLLSVPRVTGVRSVFVELLLTNTLEKYLSPIKTAYQYLAPILYEAPKSALYCFPEGKTQRE